MESLTFRKKYFCSSFHQNGNMMPSIRLDVDFMVTEIVPFEINIHTDIFIYFICIRLFVTYCQFEDIHSKNEKKIF